MGSKHPAGSAEQRWRERPDEWGAKAASCTTRVRTQRFSGEEVLTPRSCSCWENLRITTQTPADGEVAFEAPDGFILSTRRFIASLMSLEAPQVSPERSDEAQQCTRRRCRPRERPASHTHRGTWNPSAACSTLRPDERAGARDRDRGRQRARDRSSRLTGRPRDQEMRYLPSSRHGPAIPSLARCAALGGRGGGDACDHSVGRSSPSCSPRPPGPEVLPFVAEPAQPHRPPGAVWVSSPASGGRWYHAGARRARPRQ